MNDETIDTADASNGAMLLAKEVIVLGHVNNDILPSTDGGIALAGHAAEHAAEIHFTALYSTQGWIPPFSIWGLIILIQISYRVVGCLASWIIILYRY
jgi:hypothetical protein